MNGRIIRNGMLALTLSAVAIFLPAQKSLAQTCGSACQQCMYYAGAIYAQCTQSCGGDSGCLVSCQSQYVSLQQYCLTYG